MYMKVRLTSVPQVVGDMPLIFNDAECEGSYGLSSRVTVLYSSSAAPLYRGSLSSTSRYVLYILPQGAECQGARIKETRESEITCSCLTLRVALAAPSAR